MLFFDKYVKSKITLNRFVEQYENAVINVRKRVVLIMSHLTILFHVYATTTSRK